MPRKPKLGDQPLRPPCRRARQLLGLVTRHRSPIRGYVDAETQSVMFTNKPPRLPAEFDPNARRRRARRPGEEDDAPQN